MKASKQFFFLIASILLVRVYAEAAPSMAFGYLYNKSGDQNFEYLETIFPNSFANSIKNIFDVTVMKPTQVNKRLEKFKSKLKTEYKGYELAQVAQRASADFFIYGSFTPLPNDRIQILLHLYQTGSNRIFSFSNVGTMETEIFKLVDRITMILVNFLGSDNLYRSALITPKSRLGIITNLTGRDLNELYFSFFDKGYSISAVQGNSVRNNVDMKDINKFFYMTSDNSSYDIITDPNRVVFPYGTWAGQQHTDKVNYLKKMYAYYDRDYLQTKKQLVQKLVKESKNSMNTLLVIGFNKNKSKAWVRCLDIDSNDIVWMQANISGSSISSICAKMITEMNAKIKSPFDK